jgi:hypothetical protein
VVTLDHIRWLRKKRATPSYAITTFFGAKIPYEKTNDVQLQFLKDLVLYIYKGYMPLSSYENIWLGGWFYTNVPKFTFLLGPL